MSFIPLVQRVADIDTTDGEPILYVEGTHETEDEEGGLPTDHIYQGSWSFNLDTKSVVFFNGDTSSWG